MMRYVKLDSKNRLIMKEIEVVAIQENRKKDGFHCQILVNTYRNLKEIFPSLRKNPQPNTYKVEGKTFDEAAQAEYSFLALLTARLVKKGMKQVPDNISDENLIEWCKENNPFPITITEEPYATRDDRHKAKVALRRAAAHDLRSKL
jgi:hypothetical protein